MDLGRYVLEGPGSRLYDLYAVVNHSGGLGGGHYTAFAKHDATGTWHHFDDGWVREVGRLVGI